MDKHLRMDDEGTSTFDTLFFRAADRLRLEGYVAALTQDSMSLSLLSTDEAILDHYSKLLVERLRQVAPEFMLEVYFPASSEALLARFNEALSNCSIQEAMDGKGVLAAPRVWIVHDASALPDHEIQLLARLVQNFPGANIRVVLLMTVASNKQKLLNSFGRRILCWDIEPPTAEQAESLLAQARVDGREVAVRALLKKIKITPLSNQDLPALSAKSSLSEPAIPASVPEIYFDYVRSLFKNPEDPDEIDELMISAAFDLGLVALGKRYVPGIFWRNAVKAKFADNVVLAKNDSFARMVSAGLLQSENVGDDVQLRFVLDPVAEYMAAFRHAKTCNGDAQKWMVLVDGVRQVANTEGFLMALENVYLAYNGRRWTEVANPFGPDAGA